ncbi:MAG TPA: TonB-dependent siderophore receptor [Methylobacterium sp.]|jgi:iron complex outermembrane receptor protein|uniref:TonB-dependent receptor n=1 Tax=Methylorubrum sp. B1-46 TaxID=2897334 RepID=UPI001E30BF16|nr:TonB-dependent siderophore receptor [Methylorubrum sp. B1-46]UGB26314.1 TonB-dependent siderophore receptor [Methylorubrum sp. B1-46]HEV2544345.1 TonB-dependent siderophore receptor [Methylobacterium sp.]
MSSVDRPHSPAEYLPAALLLSAGALILHATSLAAQDRTDVASESHAVALEELAVQGAGSGTRLLARTPYTAAPTGLNLTAPNRSGSRLDLSPLQTPASIEVIPGQKIRERGQETVQEAITQNAAGITTIGAPGNGLGAYTSRGFAGVNSVMQLYDGTRLYVGAGTITYPFDTWNVDRIEVLRGPASVLYGDGAIGGVINVVPKKPTAVPINAARAALGSDGVKRLAFDSGGPVGESVFYRLNVSANQADGWLRQNGDFANLAVSGAVLFQATPDLAFTLSHDYGYQEPLRYFGTPLIGGRIDPRTRFNNYNVNDSRIVFKDNWTQFKTEWTPTADITIRNTAYRLVSDRHWRNVETYGFVPNTGLIRRTSPIEIFHDQEQIGNRFDAAFKGELFGLRNEFVAGFDINHIRFKHTNNAPYRGESSVDPFVFSPGVFTSLDPTTLGYLTSSNQYSLFAENRLVLSDQLSLIAGARYDAPTVRREDPRNPSAGFTKDFSAVSYRFGAVYNPTPDSALYASYATAVDPVNSLITLTLAQKDFQLSTGEQIEIGYKQSFWEGRGEFTLAGYRIKKDNLLTVDPLRPSVSVQVGSQSSHGVEAFASLGLWENWRVEGNIALLHAQYDDFQQAVAGVAVNFAGNQPVNVPERVANLWLSWAFAPRWEARAGVQFVGETFSDFANTARRPAYEVVNASVDYRVSETSHFSLRAYNLLDKVYPVTGSSAAWLLGRPRSVEVAYNIAF